VLLLLLLVAHPGAPLELRELDAAIATRPAEAKLYVERSRFLRTIGRFDEALADLDRARGLGADVDLEEARVHDLRGDHRQVDRAASAAIARRPSAGAYFLRARAREVLGRNALAAADLRSAIEHGGAIEVELALGRLLRRMGDLDGAARALRSTGAAVIARERIEVEAARGRTDEAIAVLEPMLSKARVKTDWLLLRADLHERKGLRDRAREDRRRAIVEAERLVELRPSPAAKAALARARIAGGAP
jgi:tetratricopeptide (TPR) repeat protein